MEGLGISGHRIAGAVAKHCAVASKRALFFRSSESLPFGTEIRSVAELLERLLTDARNTIDSFADAT